MSRDHIARPVEPSLQPPPSEGRLASESVERRPVDSIDDQSARNRRDWAPPWLLGLVGVLLGATLILDFGPFFNLDSTADAIITVVVGVAFVIAHGSAALGWRNLGAFLLITVVVSFAAESVGVATGWIFGAYYYTDLLGPKILGVPPLIQAAYVAMGYASLLTARIIVGLMGPVRGWANLAVALVGTFIMVAWDVAMDPYQSTVSGDWIWTGGGAYFGIALHNYVGWFGTVFLFMSLYQLYVERFPEPIRTGPRFARLFWSQPILYYGLTALGLIIVPWVGGVALPYATPANYSGSLDTLVYSLALIAFFAMGLPVVAGLVRIWVNLPLPGSVGQSVSTLPPVPDPIFVPPPV